MFGSTGNLRCSAVGGSTRLLHDRIAGRISRDRQRGRAGPRDSYTVWWCGPANEAATIYGVSHLDQPAELGREGFIGHPRVHRTCAVGGGSRGVQVLPRSTLRSLLLRMMAAPSERWRHQQHQQAGSWMGNDPAVNPRAQPGCEGGLIYGHVHWFGPHRGRPRASRVCS